MKNLLPTILAIILSLLTLTSKISIAQESKSDSTIFDRAPSRFRVSMPDSADVMKFPSINDSRFGYGGVIVERGQIKGKFEQHILPFSEKVTEYLKKNQGKVNIREVYKPDSQLFYEMPRIAIYANEKFPLDLKTVELIIGKELANEGVGKEMANHLVKAGKVKDGKLQEKVVFCAVEFRRRADGAFVIVSWMPDFSLQEKSSKE